MRNPRRVGHMGEEPSVEAFMRHLQVCVEEARTIADAHEREQRLLQLESALQEAIICKSASSTALHTLQRSLPVINASTFLGAGGCASEDSASTNRMGSIP